MDKVTYRLLDLLSIAMGTKPQMNLDLQNADWYALFTLADKHNIVPMIYEAAKDLPSFIQLPQDLKSMWNVFSYNISISQLKRTMEFLNVYEKLNQAGITALVVKGIICRQLYPNPYYRSSGDEDLYIQRDDFEQVDAIFSKAGLIRQESRNLLKEQEGVTTYDNPESDLRLELHVDLFRSKSKVFGAMNELFRDAFTDSITVDIDGVGIRTLSHNHHLLFLILHSIKHFLNIGFGIRQVCDIVMYCNAYGQEIDWDWLWEVVNNLGYQVYLANILDIGSRYLGLDPGKVNYPKTYQAEDIHSDNLLKDIVAAGIFGKSNPAQTKSGSVTMRAVFNNQRNVVLTNQRKSNRETIYRTFGAMKNGRDQNDKLLNALFPGVDYMGSHYPYCRKWPLLLPAAWLHRMITYLVKQRNPRQAAKMAGSSIAIGRRRMELLAEYQMIEKSKRQEVIAND